MLPMARILTWAVRLAALIALGSLVLEFGFLLTPSTISVLHAVDLGVVLLFVAEGLVGLATASDRDAHWREHRVALVLALLLGAYTVVSLVLAQGAIFGRAAFVGVQVYLLAKMLLDLSHANERLLSRARPEWMLAGSFVLIIAAGTALLMLPLSRGAGAANWRFVDALFTSTSAACVTGLTVRDTGTELSLRGQAVLAGLFQVGGLGLVTIAMFVSYVRQQKFQLRHATLLRDLLSVPEMGGLGRFLGYMLAITFLAEFTGAALLFHARPDLALGPRAWWAVFTSISAFCNAGFGLDSSSLEPYARSPQIVLTVLGLLMLGGLGFPVIVNLLQFQLQTLSPIRRWSMLFRLRDLTPPSRISLHTKLVLVTTAILLVAGAALFWISETDGTLQTMTAGERLLNSVFQSATTRTAGFNSVPIGALGEGTLLLVIVLMVIGASPVSTGGGIKTTTAAILVQTVRSMARNRDTVEAFGRSIPRRFVNAAVAMLAFYLLAALIVTTLLLATQSGMTFVQILFESVSALSTVGLSTGITAKLNDPGKVVVTVAMFVGRIGPLAVLWSFLSRPPGLRYEYPEENVIVA
jgi:potassium uptake TrkH family protein